MLNVTVNARANTRGERLRRSSDHLLAARGGRTPLGCAARFSFVRHRSDRRTAAGRRGDEPGRSASNRILVPGS